MKCQFEIGSPVNTVLTAANNMDGNTLGCQQPGDCHSHQPYAEDSSKVDDQACENCSSLDSSESFKNDDPVSETEQCTDIVKPLGAKNRLISVDSGFESIGKMRMIDSADDSGIIVNDHIDEEAENIIDVLKNEESRQNNNCDNKTTSKDAKVVSKKARTTTVNNIENQILDPLLINKSDGLQDVLYYIDENGSPKIREKFNKKSKLKKEREQKKKLTYGTEECIADYYVFEEKTPTCVSFSKLCKRFKESFRKFDYYKFLSFAFL